MKCTPNSCEFELGKEETDVLSVLGWKCSVRHGRHTWSRMGAEYFDPTDMSNVRGGTVAGTEPAGHTITTVQCPAGKCLSLYWNHCIDCSHTTANGGAWAIIVWVGFSLCTLFTCFIFFNGLGTATWTEPPPGYQRKVVYERIPVVPARDQARFDRDISSIAFKPFTVV